GGTLDAGQLANLESQIIAALRDAGASEAQIQRQLDTFRSSGIPSFATGGRTTAGLANLHNDEFVLGQSATGFFDQHFPGFLDGINRNPALEQLQTLWQGFKG